MICLKIIREYLAELDEIQREIRYIVSKLDYYRREERLFGVPISTLRELGLLPTPPEEEKLELTPEELEKIKERIEKLKQRLSR